MHTDLDVIHNEDEDEDKPMILEIVHADGSGVDENVTQVERTETGLRVTYTDGSSAYYEHGRVRRAWDDPSTYEWYGPSSM